MPWSETEPMNERLKFVADRQRDAFTMKDLCRRYGVSRTTGYKWLERYAEEGYEGLEERSRAPASCPHRMSDEARMAILMARQQWPNWGPKKLLAWLQVREPKLELPAPSSAGDLLRREGLVGPRPKRRSPRHPGQPARKASKPNDVWTVDFKGQFRTRDAEYCYPLTLLDLHSRYLLECKALPSTHGALVRPRFERLFRELGLPDAIRSDNGKPFAGDGLHGLSELTVWWMQLGITHERSRPAHPEDNGAHERMHRTLKQETTRPPAKNLRGQQQCFARFRKEYNDERPHEALEFDTPAARYEPSHKSYPRTITPPSYPGHFEVRMVRRGNATFAWKNRTVFLSHPLGGEHVGFEPIDDGVWAVYYYDVLLAVFDERTYEIVA